MPRMVSTTTPYSAPTQAMTIKALQERQAELAKQAAEAAAPQQIISPWQGVAQMANSFVTGMQEGRVRREAEQGRARLSELMAGGITPDEIPEIYSLDAELGRYGMEQAASDARFNRELEIKQSDYERAKADEAAKLAEGRTYDEKQAAAKAEAERKREEEINAREVKELQEKEKRDQAAKIEEEKRAQAAKIEEEKRAANAPPKLSDVSAIRQDVISDPSYKNMAQAAPIWSAMKAASAENSAGSDLNMVIALAKLYDPTSVVREGEVETVKKTGNLPDNIFSQYKYLIGDPTARLSPELRADMLRQGAIRMQGYSDAYGSTSSFYTNIAKRRGIDPTEIVPTFSVDLTIPNRSSKDDVITAPSDDESIDDIIRRNGG